MSVWHRMANHPKVSVCVLTFNRCQDLRNCLNSLRRQTYKDFQIIIVDGGSTDKTSEVAANYRVNLIRQKRKGIVCAYNLAWKNAQGEIVAYIDDDAIADSNWLASIVATFDRSNNVGGVTGPSIIPETRRAGREVMAFLEERKRFFISSLAVKIYISTVLEGKLYEINRILRSGAYTFGSTLPHSASLKKELEVDYLCGCNMAFKRSLLESVGGFDDWYSGTRADYSEPDLCLRIKRQGFRLIFNPKAKVWHLSGMVSGKTRAQQLNAYAKSFMIFYFRHIELNSIDKIFRFLMHLLFLWAYSLYNFSSSKDRTYLNNSWNIVSSLLVANRAGSLQFQTKG